MYNTIGLIELNSIAKGIEAADTMVKAADVELTFSKPVCPGKFIILVYGDAGSVKTSMEAGNEKGAQYVVDKMLLANAHPQLVPAICGLSKVGQVNAVGIMEFFSIASAVAAADTAVKAGLVKLIEVRLGIGIGGKSFVTLTGDVSSVKEAVTVGIKNAEENGMLVASSVIPSPCNEVYANLL
ncbi:MAG TPA: BMC domain-containing protein [Bacillota bacterium]|nr:BMC domain-containing protein [Bacillota bacterium]HPL53765.1 BMC domain-containing protein [Bacillota bacterium]